MSNRYLRVKLCDRVEVRELLPSDCLGVIDLLWRCYGYTYRGAGVDIYDPDQFVEALTAGRFSGLVAVTRSNEVTGVICERVYRPGEREIFGLAVAPEARSSGTGRRLAERMDAYTVAQRTRKLVMSAITRHPIAQQTVHGFGILPCYFQLGVHPPLLGFRGRERRAPVLRDTLLFGIRLTERPARAVFLPEATRPIAEAVYRTHQLERRISSAAPPGDGELLRRTRFRVELRSTWLAATLRIERFGADALDRIREVTRDLSEGFVEHIELRLPLDDPGVLEVQPQLRKLGFVVTGLEPEVGERDELCLAWVRADRISLERVCAVHPTSKALLASIASALPKTTPATPSLPATSPPRARPAQGPAARLPPPLLHARLQAARQLASGLMHEINNPLNIILGSAYSLRARLQQAAPDAKAVAHSLDAIESEVQRVARLLRQLQRFCESSRKGGGAVDLGEAVEDALALVRGVATAGEVELSHEHAPDLPRVSGSIADLEQAVIQLALNAIEASKPGSRVRIWAERREDQVAIVIEDLGRGIAPEILPRVTEPFFTTKEAGAGVGLGLSIVASVAETHGGHLEIQSTPEEGTRVSLWLPTSARPAPAQGGRGGAAGSAPPRPPHPDLLEKGTP